MLMTEQLNPESVGIVFQLYSIHSEQLVISVIELVGLWVEVPVSQTFPSQSVPIATRQCLVSDRVKALRLAPIAGLPDNFKQTGWLTSWKNNILHYICI